MVLHRVLLNGIIINTVSSSMAGMAMADNSLVIHIGSNFNSNSSNNKYIIEGVSGLNGWRRLSILHQIK